MFSTFIFISCTICAIFAQSENVTTAATSTTPAPASPTTPAPASPTAAAPVSQTAVVTNAPAATCATTTASSTEGPVDRERIKQEAINGIFNFTLGFQECAYNNVPADKNVLFAPVNIVGILATLLLGARGESKDEILDVLGFATGKDLTNKEEKIHLALGDLFQKFVTEGNSNPAVKVEISEGIFIQNGTLIKDEFLNRSKVIYKNEINQIDFSSANNDATNFINSWVKNRTNQRIQEIVQPGLSPDTKLIMINTLYFNGEWENPFYENSTWKPFHGEKETVNAKMMANSGPAYAYSDQQRSFSVLGLPYKGGDIVMYVILPNKNETLKNVLSKLTVKDLREIPNKAEKRDQITYEVPFMNIDEELDLKRILGVVGIKSVFDASRANLSGIAENLFVSKAVHKVNLDVTEAGSTGAAATSLNIETRFPEIPFIANRPFSFYVYHRTSSLILFWGSINLPTPNKKV